MQSMHKKLMTNTIQGWEDDGKKNTMPAGSYFLLIIVGDFVSKEKQQNCKWETGFLEKSKFIKLLKTGVSVPRQCSVDFPVDV